MRGKSSCRKHNIHSRQPIEQHKTKTRNQHECKWIQKHRRHTETNTRLLREIWEFKPCLNQPCDHLFLANSYDLNRKPIVGISQRLNTIRRDRTAAERCSYDRRTTVVRALRNRRYVASEFDSVTNTFEFAKLSSDCRCSCVCHTSSQNTFSCMFFAC